MQRFCMLSMSHPALSALYFSIAIASTMLIVHPVLSALSLAGALWLSCLIRGMRATGRTIVFMLPLSALIVLVNPFFSASGVTVVAYALGRSITLESLAYGATMSMLICAVMVWCEDAACALDDEAVMALGGKILPRVSLIVSMVSRLIPTYMSRSHEISYTERANTAAYGTSPRASSRTESRRSLFSRTVGHASHTSSDGLVRRAARRFGILLSWSLESSVQTADAMEAYGWRADRPRSVYRRRSLSSHDKACMAFVCMLAVGLTISAVFVCMGFSFFPRLASVTDVRFALPYGVVALFFALPSLFQIVEARIWMR